jgi:hypothetical protein
MVPVNTRVLHVSRLGSPWVIAPSSAEHTRGYLPCPATDLVSSLAVPEGNDYLDREDVYHHWLPSLVLSLVEGSVARRRVRPRPVFSLQQPMQAHCYRGRCGRESGHEKSLKAWLSVCRARPHRRGENQSLRLQSVVSALHSDKRSVGQVQKLCKWTVWDFIGLHEMG